MSTLAEIETAVRRLSPGEQKELLRHLENLVRRQRDESGRQGLGQWMDRLENLRAMLNSGSHTLTSEQILAESREERA